VRYAHVGASGLEISRIVLGMMSFGTTSERAWHLDIDAARPLVRRATEAGITAYDTADVYDRGVSEQVTGELLREVFTRREDYVLATKVYYPMSEAPGDRGSTAAPTRDALSDGEPLPGSASGDGGHDAARDAPGTGSRAAAPARAAPSDWDPPSAVPGDGGRDSARAQSHDGQADLSLSKHLSLVGSLNLAARADEISSVQIVHRRAPEHGRTVGAPEFTK